ncbi:uncharacterized membrane protein HdeD (DUF308 family) [Mucilaginibacter oryzae]|uniref:Uncharacterized membrane protein HdeD (DUF308 family) n=1 Tax=Mucilaginibacter oryzae TaxID=468058 RepID=A0A316HLZ4_9SPHI|nr:DUF308 domain-containing protein [Mucilaginibacter oryzae]PWK79235.1 uncharacterized membrane protein HdeD (DUF308 family) [Mucilaginibacter oryzae]
MENVIDKRTIIPSRYWVLMLLSGILLSVLGVWIILSPLQSYLSLSLTFAIGMIATGFFETAVSVMSTRHIERWGWLLASGLIDIAIGSYLFSYPAITMMLLPVIVGFWLLVRGIMGIGSAIDMRAYGISNWGWILFNSLVVVFFSVGILAYPAFGIANLIIWTGLAFFGAGIFRVVISIKIKELSHRIGG